MKEDKTYNGWKNKQTWNVALWINNDEPLYRAAVEFVRNSKSKRALYARFVDAAGLNGQKTPDGYAYTGKRLALRELNEMLVELAGK